MLSVEDLAFVNAPSRLKVSPALLKELRRAIAEKKGARRPAVPVGRRSHENLVSSHRTPHQKAGKRKASDLAGSGGCPESAGRRLAPDAGSVLLSANSLLVTGEQASSGGRHLVSPEGRAIAATSVTFATAAPQKLNGPLMPTNKVSDPSELAVSHGTATRRMSSDMSRPMSGFVVCTTNNAQMVNASLPAGERINMTPIDISGVDDTRSFLAWLRAS
jgi:hypothetical protein